jgi:hypothetical protein
MDQRQRKQWTRATKAGRRVWRRNDRMRGGGTTKEGQGRTSGAENKPSWLVPSSLPQSTALVSWRAKPKGTKWSDCNTDYCDWQNHGNRRTEKRWPQYAHWISIVRTLCRRWVIHCDCGKGIWRGEMSAVFPFESHTGAHSPTLGDAEKHTDTNTKAKSLMLDNNIN